MTEAEVRRVLALMPESCFIRQYCSYAERQTGGNLGYSLGVALAMVSATSPRELVMDGPKRGTTPNIYVLVVGPSGEAEKSITVDVGLDLLTEAVPDVIGDDPTADESLLKALQERPSQIWVYPELAGFLSKTGGTDQRGRGIRDAFMEAYDGKSKGRRYSRGPRVYAERPRPTFLGACTPRHLEDHTSDMDWVGGFCSRLLFFSGEKERDVPWAEPMPKMRNFLIEWLSWSVSANAGQSEGLSFAAQKLWLSWQKEQRARLSQKKWDERLRGIISRNSLMAAKCSLLIAWASGLCLEPWVLAAEILEAGIAVADLTLSGTLTLAESIAPTPEMREQRRLFNAIEDFWTPFGDALRDSNLTKRKGAIYIETLMEQGVISCTTQNGTAYYRRTDNGTVPYDYSVEGLPRPLLPGEQPR